ncbi:PIN domain-containing protein [Actinophytocola oryzae]|uniref:PIN domain-containing protein n=1 Tax=Actinophytocola oryzae TaxID=502181 RepID=A0A4R7UPI3_9PSEU|nr:PIN domain-containing protein [Actinophytocola oryzae]TDV35433.1 PIN domain-containing protein [Actinophytocola oryzae]
MATHLYTAHYWRLFDGDYDIASADPARPVPDPCGQEAAAQLTYLTALAAQVERSRALAASPGQILVYDTNSLMHYHPPGAIPWNTVTKATTARLVVPLVVVDELDAKKYAGSEKMANRAAAALRELDKILDGAQPGMRAPGRVRVECLVG